MHNSNHNDERRETLAMIYTIIQKCWGWIGKEGNYYSPAKNLSLLARSTTQSSNTTANFK